MSATEINNLLRRRPFMPFRVHVTGDVYYDIRVPELASCGLSVLFIGMSRGVQSEHWDEPVLVAIRHITRVEPLVEADTMPAA